MPVVTASNLDRIPGISKAHAERFAPHLRAAMIKYHITTPARICSFLANVLEESGHLVYVAEIWGPTEAQKKYELPHDTAKRLGNTHAGDGRRYQGRGLIQVTGRANYAAVSKALGVDFVNVPRLLEQDEYAALSAAWFWDSRRLNHLADLIDFTKSIDTAANMINFRSIVKAVNGGYTHLRERVQNYKDIKAVFYG